MAMQLPPEVLQLVLSAALEDEAPPQRQQIRQAFVSVCRAWAGSVGRFQQVEVIGCHQLIRLTALPSSSHVHLGHHLTWNEDSARAVCDRVQSLYVELSDMDSFAPAEVRDDALARLLSWCPNVRCLELRIGDRFTPERQSPAPSAPRPSDQDECSLGETVRTALAGLSQLTTFTLGGLTSAQPTPGFSPHLLRR